MKPLQLQRHWLGDAIGLGLKCNCFGRWLVLLLTSVCSVSGVEFSKGQGFPFEEVKGYDAGCVIPLSEKSRTPVDHNSISNILLELETATFSNSVYKVLYACADVTNFPTYKLLVWTNWSGGLELDVPYRSAGFSKKQVGLFCEVIQRFVSDRMGGHTWKYEIELLKQDSASDEGVWSPEDRIARKHHIPRGWVHRWSATGYYYVIDGAIAWEYGDRTDVVTVLDAQQLDPKIAPLIEAARESVWTNGGFVGTARDLDRKVQQLLKREHGIDWLSPSELNPHRIWTWINEKDEVKSSASISV